MNVHLSAKSRADEMLQKLTAHDHMVDKNMQTLASNTDDIKDNVGVAVRSLQFEDICSQRMDHVQHSLTALQDGFATLTEIASASVWADASNGSDIDRELSDLSEKITRSWHKPVQRGAMKEGDVDLF